MITIVDCPGTNIEVITLYLATITVHPFVGWYPLIEGKLINERACGLYSNLVKKKHRSVSNDVKLLKVSVLSFRCMQRQFLCWAFGFRSVCRARRYYEKDSKEN